MIPVFETNSHTIRCKPTQRTARIGVIFYFRSGSIMLYSWCSLGWFTSGWVWIRFENRNHVRVRLSRDLLRFQNHLQSSCSIGFSARNLELSAQLRLSFEIERIRVDTPVSIFQSTFLENCSYFFNETLLGNEIEPEYHNGEIWAKSLVHVSQNAPLKITKSQ